VGGKAKSEGEKAEGLGRMGNGEDGEDGGKARSEKGRMGRWEEGMTRRELFLTDFWPFPLLLCFFPSNACLLTLVFCLFSLLSCFLPSELVASDF
jgi:hypothetical protein